MDAKKARHALFVVSVLLLVATVIVYFNLKLKVETQLLLTALAVGLFIFGRWAEGTIIGEVA